jgi:hypothetical protein
MANLMKRRFPGINAGPLFYISTHGYYDMEKYVSGSDPIQTVVPERTLVIETATLENYCFFTSVKKVMEPLFQDRERLLTYLGGLIPDEDRDKPGVQRIILLCLSTCLFYMPGAPIANRILEFTGGRYHGDDKSESERTDEYSSMGFFKYNARGDSEKILPSLRTNLIVHAYGKIGARGVAIAEPRYESYEKMFPKIQGLSDRGEFKIIFFSSCAELKRHETPRPDLERRIKDLQSEAVAVWKRDMRTDIRASYNVVKKADITNANVEALGFNPEEESLLKRGNYLGKQIHELTMELRPRNDGAGAGAGSAAAAAVKKPGGGRYTRNRRGALKRKTRKNRYL